MCKSAIEKIEAAIVAKLVRENKKWKEFVGL